MIRFDAQKEGWTMFAVYVMGSLGVIAGNYVYQFFCSHPDWAAATERSWFQGLALLLVGIAVSLRSINP
jgi:hypothetical protein